MLTPGLSLKVASIDKNLTDRVSQKKTKANTGEEVRYNKKGHEQGQG